ncbi:MAG: hypothetical protein ABI228_02225 [Burkholderiaceae bacterium]
MNHLKSSPLAKLSVVMAALALQGAAWAATPAGSSTAPVATPSTTASQPENSAAWPDRSMGHSHKAMRGHHQRGAMWVPGYGPLDAAFVQSLALNDAQNTLLKDAQATQKSLQKTRRESMRDARKARLEQLKSGKVDPHAAIKETSDKGQAMVNGRREVNQKWLAVWDSLDATQQQKIASFLDKRAERRAAHAQKRDGGSDAVKSSKPAS